jgi:hypothetical protein
VNPTNIVIGILVLGLLITRQLQRRSVREDRSPIILLALFVIGIGQVGFFLHQHSVGTTAIAMMVVSLVVAAASGAARAYTIRLWREGGVLYRQGNLLTVLLWIVGVAVHFGGDALLDHGGADAGLASTSILLYLAVSLGVQRVVVNTRAKALGRQTAGALG